MASLLEDITSFHFIYGLFYQRFNRHISIDLACKQPSQRSSFQFLLFFMLDTFLQLYSPTCLALDRILSHRIISYTPVQVDLDMIKLNCCLTFYERLTSIQRCAVGLFYCGSYMLWMYSQKMNQKTKK